MGFKAIQFLSKMQYCEGIIETKVRILLLPPLRACLAQASIGSLHTGCQWRIKSRSSLHRAA